jgi:hypothetical protein
MNQVKLNQLSIIILSVALIFTNLPPRIHAQAPHGTASEEAPRGVIDGTNTIFTLNFQPAPWGSIHVYRNGLRQQRNNDFTLGGPNHTQVIFNLIATPQPGDILLADYTY